MPARLIARTSCGRMKITGFCGMVETGAATLMLSGGHDAVGEFAAAIDDGFDQPVASGWIGHDKRDIR